MRKSQQPPSLWNYEGGKAFAKTPPSRCQNFPERTAYPTFMDCAYTNCLCQRIWKGLILLIYIAFNISVINCLECIACI